MVIKKKYHKNTNLHRKNTKPAVILESFLFTFKAMRISIKKSELIFKYYFTIIRPKHIGNHALFLIK